MTWANVFFGLECEPTFNSLIEYFDSIDYSIETLKKEGIEKIVNSNRELAKEQSWSEEDEWAEYSVKRQEHDAKYEMLFTNFSRYSFIVLVGLVLEDQLYRLCLALQESKKLPLQPERPYGDIINNLNKYVASAGVTVSSNLWESINDFRLIRNCIVHSSGNISHSKYKTEIIAIAKKNAGKLFISHILDNHDLTPLYLEGGMIMIESTYCKSIVSDIKLLFSELIKNSGLPTKMRYDGESFIFE